MKALFDRKVYDTTVNGYNPEEIRKWLSAKEIDNLKYYYYLPSSKFPRESRNLKTPSPEQAISFLNGRFSETLDLFVEIQHKEFKSGRHEIILKGKNSAGEILRLCILSLKRASDETTK